MSNIRIKMRESSTGNGAKITVEELLDEIQMNGKCSLFAKVTMEPERLDALRYFLSAKEKRTPEKELQRLLEELYEKYVPADTREYLDSKNKPAVRPRPRRTAKGGRTAQTQDNNSDQDNPGQDVSTGYDMGGRHDEKV